MSRPAMTVIELLVVIAVLAVLAAIVTATLADNRERQGRVAVTQLRTLQSAVDSYRTLYGRYPVDLSLAPPGQPLAATVNGTVTLLNKNMAVNLRRDWSKGNFSSFDPSTLAVDSGIDRGDGRSYFADPWGRPYVCRLRTELKGGKERIVGVYIYSAGEDGRDDFADLETWLAAGHRYPPSDEYLAHLADTQPSGVNVDNVYPPLQ